MRIYNDILILILLRVCMHTWFYYSGFADVFDVDFFIQHMNGFVKVVKTLPPEIASKEPVPVDCSKRKGQFDYVDSVLPSLLKHKYISFTPQMSQRRDRYDFVSHLCLLLYDNSLIFCSNTKN